MKHAGRAKKYTVEQLVAAAYRAARETTPKRVLAALLVSKILESWLRNSGRLDVVNGLSSSIN